MQRATHWLFALALLACGSTVSRGALANETFCITSSGGVGNTDLLLSAMNVFVYASDETIYIHLEQGVYTFNASQNLIGGNASLHLVGGFVPGTSCTQRVIDPSLTTLKGGYSLLTGQKDGELLVDGIEFRSWGGGVEFRVFGDGNATLRNIIADGNGAGIGIGAITFDTDHGGAAKLRVENCLIRDNSAVVGLNILSDGDNVTTIVDNCTILNNASGLVLGDVVDTFKGTMFGYSNIIRGNTGGDVDTSQAALKPIFAYSDIGSITGAATTSNNIDSDPMFAGADPPFATYELLNTSPAINKGAAASTVVAQTGDSTFAYADTDIRGRTRRIGSRVDMGAYESTVDDTAAQTVYSTGDAVSGNTLRAAITTANSNPNPTTIVFDISGGCPQVITLSSPLPDITSDVTIDGYSQPGSAVNTQVPAYDGTICVVLRGGGAVDHALATSATGRLTVRGVEFEGFTNAAVHLAGGSGHVVTGDGFAAFAGSSGNKDGVLIDGTATYAQIGSYAFGDRNVFDQSSDAAIKLSSNGAGHHVIQGNYLGFDFDGANWVGAHNKYAVYLADSASNEISYNFVGNSVLSALYLTGSSTTANRIIDNSIGSAPANDANAGGGYGTCSPVCFGGFAAIDVLSGAHDNYVGAIGGNGGNNYIVNNDGPGVWVEGNAGNGNRVYGNNVIHDNNAYLAIDLGTLGPTLNDVGDGDSGGNKLQNYPTLSQAMRIEADVIRLSGSLVAQTGVAAGGYRFDVFWTDSCLFSGGGADTPRGELKRYVGFFNAYSDGSSPNLAYSAVDVIASTNVPAPTPANPGYLFAIATDAAGNTSEPGPCRTFVDDHIFTDGF